jgi:hypothetical protein
MANHFSASDSSGCEQRDGFATRSRKCEHYYLAFGKRTGSEERIRFEELRPAGREEGSKQEAGRGPKPPRGQNPRPTRAPGERRRPKRADGSRRSPGIRTGRRISLQTNPGVGVARNRDRLGCDAWIDLDDARASDHNRCLLSAELGWGNIQLHRPSSKSSRRIQPS